MNAQELILLRFRESVKAKQSFTQQLADTLDISYDAAYRRQTGMAKLTIDEAITLAISGQFSLDTIMTAAAPLTALGTITTPIDSMDTLIAYFKAMHHNLQTLGKKNVKFIYSAKDIPVFHHFNDSALCRFKIYVWLHLLVPKHNLHDFDKFDLPLDLKTLITAVKDVTNRFEHVEIWNDTTISSSLKQIHYFHAAGLLSLETALQLCKDLHALVQSLQEKIDDATANYDIYYHELLIMTNNSIAFKEKIPVAAFITTTMLGYIQFNAPDMLERMQQFYFQQMALATSLKQGNFKERVLFFAKHTQKINALENALKNTPIFDL